MAFTLTTEHFRSLIGPCAEGDRSKFVAAIDPEVHWIVCDPIDDPKSLAGTYVRLHLSFPFPPKHHPDPPNPQ